MPNDGPIKHSLMGGKLRVYRRENGGQGHDRARSNPVTSRASHTELAASCQLEACGDRVDLQLGVEAPFGARFRGTDLFEPFAPGKHQVQPSSPRSSRAAGSYDRSSGHSQLAIEHETTLANPGRADQSRPRDSGRVT